MKFLNILLCPVKWIIKFFAKIFLVLTLSLILILACGNFWLPWIIRWQTHSLTGFSAKIESSRGSLFKGYVDLRELAINNPSDRFNESSFISFNELGIDVKLTSIPTNVVILEKVIIDIDTITLVKNIDGTYNYSVFIDNINDSFDNEKSSTTASSKEKTLTKKLHIEKLTFAIKSVKIIDEKTGNVNEYSIKYEREFSNIDDISSLIKPLVTDLGKYGLSAFIQSTFQSVLELPGISQATDGLTKVKDVSKDTIKDIGIGLKNIFSK